jgi:hypothetical protein
MNYVGAKNLSAELQMTAMEMLFGVITKGVKTREVTASESTARLLPQAWGVAKFIDHDRKGINFAPQIAMDTSGNAIAVWVHFDRKYNCIWFNYYCARQGWLGANKVDTSRSIDAFSPRIRFDGQGVATLVWLECYGSRKSVWSTRYVKDGGWTESVLLTINKVSNATTPQVAVSTGGATAAVWCQFDGFNTNVWVNYSANGRDWGMATVIGDTNPGDVFDPQISIDSAGNTIAVWMQSFEAGSHILSNYYAVDKGWHGVVHINLGHSYAAIFPRVATDALGNGIAVWQQSDGMFFHIWTNRYSVDMGWGNAEMIDNNRVGSADSPQLAVNPNGNAVALWQSFDGTHGSIWANYYTANLGWGGAVLIESYSSLGSFEPNVAIDANGNAVALWKQHDGTYDSIWTSRYCDERGWSAACMIEKNVLGDAHFPCAAMVTNAVAIAVWKQSHDTHTNIRASIFR